MAASRKKAGPKQVTSQAVTGELGVNFVAETVLKMGCAWHPTNQPVEAGIDGEIELVQPDTRAATNIVIRVQVKSTVRDWPAETPTSFEYIVRERDLDYWFSGNTPVILVVTRPHLREAYWVDVKTYFASPAVRKARKVRFDKKTMALTPSSLADLFAIGRPKSMGLYLAPMPKAERLYTNMLRVTRVPETLWLAETDLRPGKKTFDALREAGLSAPEFAFESRKILTPHDLTDPRWRPFVDRGTVEEFPTDEWAHAADNDKRRLFVQLLNRCLYERAWQVGAAHTDELLYFRATPDLSPKEEPYRSVSKQSVRTVFQAHRYTKGERIGDVSYCAHAACYTQFRRYERDWFLEIVPTYFFTSDGRRRHPRSDRLLSGIKKLEKQGAVLYQLVMWASILRGAEEVDAEWFSTNTYPFLEFGALETLELDIGIDDEAWLKDEDPDVAKAGADTMRDLPLFEEVNPYAPEPASGEES
jgi:hypothetical protein